MDETQAFDPGRVRALVDRLGEPPEPPGELAGLFDEIQGALRVPFATSLFHLLALDPPVLRTFWAAVGPGLASREADAEVERLIEHALSVAPSPDLGAQHRAWLSAHGIDERELGRIAAVNRSVQYASARALLAAAALAAAVGGDGAERPAPVLHPRARALAPGAIRPEPVPRAGLNSAVGRRLEGLRNAHGHPFVAGYFRALARWPAYLERAEADLALVVGSLRFRAGADLLATLAEVAARSLVPRRPIAPGSVLGGDDLRALAECFHHRILPDVLLDATFLRALGEGLRAARQAPFEKPAPA